MAFFSLSSSLVAQETRLGAADANATAVSAVTIPDAPQPQIELADAQSGQTQAAQQPATNGQGQNAQQSAAKSDPPSDSNGSRAETGTTQNNAQSSSQQPGPGETQHKKASEQIKQQEQQRVLGVVPTFNVSYRSDAASMSPGQKVGLAFRSAIDPFTFAAGFAVAGLHEALGQDRGFGWGAEGYFKRAGAAYLDAFNGTMIGNGFLPIVFHQDPRFFRRGYGSVGHRLIYAMSTSIICKHDNSNRWEPNYSNVLGNIAAGAISNAYYPDSNSAIGTTITNGLIVTAEGTIGGVFNEFWPDISRKVLHKDPTRGLDAQVRAQYAAEKQEKQKQKAEQKQNQN